MSFVNNWGVNKNLSTMGVNQNAEGVLIPLVVAPLLSLLLEKTSCHTSLGSIEWALHLLECIYFESLTLLTY